MIDINGMLIGKNNLEISQKRVFGSFCYWSEIALSLKIKKNHFEVQNTTLVCKAISNLIKPWYDIDLFFYIYIFYCLNY